MRGGRTSFGPLRARARSGCVQSVFAASHRGHHHGGKISGGSRWSMRAVGTRPVLRRRGSSRMGCGIRGSSRVPRPRRGGSSCAGPAGPAGAGGTGARLTGPARAGPDRAGPDPTGPSPAGRSPSAGGPGRGAGDWAPVVAADWGASPMACPSPVRLAAWRLASCLPGSFSTTAASGHSAAETTRAVAVSGAPTRPAGRVPGSFCTIDDPPISPSGSARPRAPLTVRCRTSGARATPSACASRTSGPSAGHEHWRRDPAPSPRGGRRRTPWRGITQRGRWVGGWCLPTFQLQATPASSPSPHAVLGPYDDTLSCALDPPTLDEIVEEFVPRRFTLDRDAAGQAERILARHRDRIAALAMTTHAIDTDPDAGGPS
jgi:hypothetical protein